MQIEPSEHGHGVDSLRRGRVVQGLAQVSDRFRAERVHGFEHELGIFAEPAAAESLRKHCGGCPGNAAKESGETRVEFCRS